MIGPGGVHACLAWGWKVAVNFAFDVLARAVRDAKVREIRRITRLERAATAAAGNGDVPAFSFDGMRVELAHLAAAEELLTIIAVDEVEVRKRHPQLMSVI